MVTTLQEWAWDPGGGGAEWATIFAADPFPDGRGAASGWGPGDTGESSDWATWTQTGPQAAGDGSGGRVASHSRSS